MPFTRLFKVDRAKHIGMGCMGMKAGMTTWFVPTGEAVSCTVITTKDGSRVTHINCYKQCGYNSLQMGFNTTYAKKLTNPELRHLKKNGITSLQCLAEFAIRKVKRFSHATRLENTKYRAIYCSMSWL